MHTNIALLSAASVDIGSVMNNGMSIGERLKMALQVTLLGLGTVFSVLALIWLVLTLFRVFMYDIPERKRKKAAAAAPELPSVDVTATEIRDREQQSGETDPKELVAVITAAIAAASGTPASSLRVVSFRKTGSVRH